MHVRSNLIILLPGLCFLLLISCASFGQQARGLSVPYSGEIPKAGNVYAWIVGISQYQNVPSLQFADSDAVLFKKFIVSNSTVQSENILEMYDEQATGALLIVKGLSWIDSRNYQPGDKLYIFLAGHGDAMDKDEYFFLGSDIETGTAGAKNNYMAGSALQMFNLKMKIKRIAAKGVEVFLVMDACRTNELEGNKLNEKYTEGITEMPEGEIMMFSASPGQSAIESKEVGGGHGLFTWYLVGGLAGQADKNQDGQVTLFELKNYVEEKVSNAAMTNFKGHEQFPFFCCSDKYSKAVSKRDSNFDAVWTKATKKENTDAGLAVGARREIRTDTIPEKQKILFKLFNDAILTSHLTGDSSASFFYETFAKQFPTSGLLNDMKYSLAAELVNSAQQKINIYLRGKDQVPQRISDSVNKTQFFYKVASEVLYKDASAKMLRALSLLKDDSSLAKKMRTKYYFLLSNSYFQQDTAYQFARTELELERAIDTIKEAIKTDTSASYLYNTLGNLYKERADYDSAEIAFNKAISLSPDWTYSYNNLGVTYHRRKQYAKAEDQYRKAIKIDSNYVVAYNSLGNLYNDQLNYTEAEKYYKKALLVDSNFYMAEENLSSLRKKKIRDNTPILKDKKGIRYHNEPKLTKPNPKTVKIGELEWTAANLNTAYYRNGDKIKEAVTAEEWAECDSLHIGCWCYYGNSVFNGQDYGKLYNWYAVNDARGLAPRGFHIPTRIELNSLLVTTKRSAASLKAKQYWQNNGAGTDEFHWACLPGGYREDEGFCENLGLSAHFWCADYFSASACSFYLMSNEDIVTIKYTSPGWGFSVRCVKDQ